MKIWLNAVGYQAVWFCAVVGAGHGLAWPGPAAAAVFIPWQYAVSDRRATDLRLLGLALVLGGLVDGVLAMGGYARYAASWPSQAFAPVWILAVWAAFAMTLTQSLRFLSGRAMAASLVGAIGGPLAYLGAARGWHAVEFAAPRWHAIAWLSLAWAVAMPLLATAASRAVRTEGQAPGH